MHIGQLTIEQEFELAKLVTIINSIENIDQLKEISVDLAKSYIAHRSMVAELVKKQMMLF